MPFRKACALVKRPVFLLIATTLVVVGFESTIVTGHLRAWAWAIPWVWALWALVWIAWLGTFKRITQLLSGGTAKHADLVPEGQVLQLKGSARTEDRGQGGKECRKKMSIGRENYQSSIIPTLSNRSGFRETQPR